MFKKQNTLKVTKIDNPLGGKGTITKVDILTNEETEDKINIFAKVTVSVGSSIGKHQHVNDSEMYYIVQGTGIIQDDDETITVNEGDVLYTPKSGWHALENTGDIDLIFVALILP